MDVDPNEAEAQGAGGGLVWRLLPASLVVVSADKGGVVLAFAVAVAGPGAALAPVLIGLPLPGAPLRLGPFPINALKSGPGMKENQVWGLIMLPRKG